MLRRWSTSWCWGVVLLALLGPAVALACRPEPQTAWKQATPDGRFELSMDAPANVYRGPFTLTLRDVRAQKVLWTRQLDSYAYSGNMIIAPNGQYVARAETFSETVVLFGPDGQERGRWSIAEQLKPSEQRMIAHTSCGREWLGERRFEGEVLVLEVLTGGVVPPIYEQPKGTVMRIDALTGKLTREAAPPERSTAELIQEWRSSDGKCCRYELERALLGRSADVGIGGDAELSRFWVELLTTPQTETTHSQSMEGLSLVATDEELRKLARLPKGSPERNEALLWVLERRLPDEAEAYALRALEGQWPTDLLRQRAVYFLSKRQPAVVAKALELALVDASGKVRDNALDVMAYPPVSAASIEKVFSFCDDRDEGVRKRAVESLRRMFDAVKGEERLAGFEVLRRMDAAGKLKLFPEGWLILGGVADTQGDRTQALELYKRGLKQLNAMEEERRKHSMELWLEATLQLAFQAKKEGNLAEVKRLARQVLADERGRRAYVCAPRPNEYADELCGRGTGKPTADYVARQLLEEVEGKDKSKDKKR
jgi:hypothetical protein